ncbi:hypothetical protein EJB05_07099 [Eragrostis curvula]|uniref:DUF4378 domain-containing protein n=1 Tax=Eragrostis curvula TaxID=38414 RepID=A0A5J9WHS9_9POAL|nr:hypothetical protein EJB05_07099 [Eragrostis curvula]
MASVGRGRSRRREDGGGSSDRNAAHSAAPTVGHQEVASLRKQATYPGILPDPLFEAGNRQSKSRKASGVPMKMLIDEEISKDVNGRHISPGAVGRLMGLDSLPTSGTHNQCRYTQSHALRASPGSSHDRLDRYGLYDDIPHRRSADDIKDVFEIMEASKTKMHRSPTSRSGNRSSRPDKIDDADIDFVRQKFMDAKRLSTNESLHMSEELNETLDALVSNQDLLLEFLQKFDPVVRRDLHNHGSPSSAANCITILKPSRKNQFAGTDNIYPQGKVTESYINMQKEAKHSLRKQYPNVSSQRLKEDSGSLRQKLSRSSHQENTDKRSGPTRIVVLKPNLEKAPHFDFGRHKESQDIGRWSPYTEEYMCQVSLEDSETLGHMGKGSREVAREITKQMRAARGGSRKHAVKSEVRTSISEKRPQFLSPVTRLKTSEAFHRSSELCDSWASSSFNSSPTYSTETSVSKEAKKHLSNRWKKSHQHQRQITDNDGFSTLGDMLALSDQDTSEAATHKMACRKCPKGETQTDRMQGCSIYPFGISSNDGWRDVVASNLTRSKSLPPSFSRGVQKSNSRKRTGTGRHNEFSMLKDVLKVGPQYSEYACHNRQRQPLSRGSTFHGHESDLMAPDNEERMATEREIHVNYEEPANGIAMPDISEQSQHPAHIDHELDAVRFLHAGSTILDKDKEPLPPAGLNQQILELSAIAFDGRNLVPNLDDLVTEDERHEYHQAEDYPDMYEPHIQSESCVGIDHQQVDDNQTLCIPPNESESPTSSQIDDQQSPISVLESSMDAEDIYSGDFEKISADLQGKMQLRFLKRETTDNGDDSELFILSDDETACQPPPEMKRSYAFRDEEERDFSYVLDMLTDLGIHAANQDELLNNCYLLECPAGPDLYDKLENKYRSLILWPQPERKLLFDTTNAVLEDMITSLMVCGSKGLLRRWYPGWDRKEFVDMVWQRVVQLRQEMEFNQERLSLDVEWIGSEDGVYLVGSDIGSALQEDLLDEVIADFLVVPRSAKFRG